MEEESVKKKIFVVLLSAVLCLQGLSSTDAVMAEEAATTVDEVVVENEAEDTLVGSSISGSTAGIYIASLDVNGFTAGLVLDSSVSKDNLEYRWLYYDKADETWNVAQDWTAGNEWVNWKPDKYGEYVIQAEVREIGTTEAVTSATGITYHPEIKGKCQMPYTGEGGGYLIGVESYNNNDYSYEMLILDCTLLAEGKDAWTYTTGKCKSTENAFWTIWQPEYGYYWTLFRVYDAAGNLIDEDCYGFENTQVSQANVKSMIADVDCKSAIEADVTLNGTGTGSHAKLVICTATSAVSFGLQYDTCAVAPYTGKTMVMMENVFSNAAGGQQYTRPGDVEVALGQKVHLMVTINEDGSGAVYVNNQQVGTYSNPGLAGQHLYLRVEGSARLNGDTVDAKFENIKLKNGEAYNPDQKWPTNDFTTCSTIHYTCADPAESWKNITISGVVSGLAPGQDWDSAYEQVSGIVQLNY